MQSKYLSVPPRYAPGCMLPPPHLTCELIFADPDFICHVACTETIPKRYGTPILFIVQDHMLRYSEVFRTVMLPPGVACTELKIHSTSSFKTRPVSELQ